MQETTPFLIYRSSAGSGKTYTLAREYIRLALAYPQAFRAILAVTFTNKATQEMKDRIIGFLDRLSQGKDPVLAAYLIDELKLKPVELEIRAGHALADILHGYTHFSVSTIDSFFQKVIRSFAREIGLQSGFKVELDQNKVLNELVDRVMQDVGHKADLTKWLVQFATEKVEEGKSWDLRKNIMELGREVFSEKFKLIEPGLQAASERDFLNDFRKDLIAVRRKFEKDMQACGSKAMALMTQNALTVDDFSYKKSGVAGYIQNLAEGNAADKKDGFVPGKRVLTASEDPEKWTSGSSKRRDEIINAVEGGGLQQALQEALACYREGYTLYMTASESLRFFNTFGILTDLTAKLQDYRADEGVMLISDAAPFLNQVISGNDSPFVYEKVGSYIRHYLVDEFQDTSSLQWENLHPLIFDAISQGMLSMVVGDVKQSIYRWRGGDWSLLLNGLSERFAGLFDARNLSHNYRSTKEVIRFNNALFSMAPAMLAAKLAEQVPDDAETVPPDYLQEVYEQVRQHVPDKADTEEEGYVKITFLPEKDESYESEEGEKYTWKDEVLRRLPADIERLQDMGYAAGDIAVLTRTARDGKLVADKLLAYKSEAEARADINYEVVSSESLFVDTAYSVHILLQALRHLHNREDTVALANLVHDYNRYILQDTTRPVAELLKPRSADDDSLASLLPPDFWHHRDTLARHPLYELCERLIAAFSLDKMKDEYPYIQAFQDLVLAYSREERADIGGYLDWWAEKGRTSTVPMPENIDAIRILTIHKSKGLQFPVVLIPFCDWDLDHGRMTNILWCDTEGLPEPFSRTPYLPVRYGSSLAHTYFAGEYLEEMARAFLDNLNLLYVALTRPEKALVIYTHSAFTPKKPPLLKTVGHMLHQSVSHTLSVADSDDLNLTSCYDEDEAVFEFGALAQNAQAASGPEGEERPVLARYPIATEVGKRLVIRSRSPYRPGREEEDNEEARTRGNVMHHILGEMGTWQDKAQALRKTAFVYGLSAEEVAGYDQMLDRLGQLSQVQEWFGPGYEVKREAEMVAPGGDVYRPDRVMRQGTRLIVVDFKTGHQDPRYHRQIQGYMTQIEAMGYKDVQGWLLYIDSLETVPVEDSGQMNLFD